MTPDLGKLVEQGSFRLSALQRYAEAHGFVYREKWGEFLDRYSKKVGAREQNLLIPNKMSLSDFERRVFDFVTVMSEHLNKPLDRVINEVSNSDYQVVRITANEGGDDFTLSFDAGIDLLQNGLQLIDSSATLALAKERSSYIRGRRPDLVRRYVDQVRIGQTEIGSFVVTLLMPSGFCEDELGLANSANDALGSKVAENLISALRTAELVGKSESRFSDEALIQRGLNYNFSSAVANMVEAVDSLRIGIAPIVPLKNKRLYTEAKFSREAAEPLRSVEKRLAPPESRREVLLQGVITRLSEASKKRSGSLTLECQIKGEKRSVHVPFRPIDRTIVFDAFERKSEFDLVVFGTLRERGGHLRLEDANAFDMVVKGDLT